MNTFPELSAPEDAEILWKGIKGKNKGGKKNPRTCGRGKLRGREKIPKLKRTK